MTKSIGLCIALLLPFTVTFACEPASVDVKHFYQLNDKNHDGKFQLAEWQNMDFSGSNYESGFESPLSPQQIFQQMDKNNNGVIDKEEFYHIYVYLNNPCADFDARNSQADKKPLYLVDKLTNFFKALF